MVLMQREIHHREVKANKLLQTEASRDSDAMHYGFSNRCYSQLFSATKISHSCTFNCSLRLLYSYEPQPTMTTSHLVTRDSERHSGKCRETINQDEFDKVVNKRVCGYLFQDSGHKPLTYKTGKYHSITASNV